MTRIASTSRRKRLAGHIVVVTGVILFSGASRAAESPGQDAINPDRPGIAEGSGVVGDDFVQIETGIQYERRRAGGETERTLFVPALLRVGLGSHWEARVEGNTFTHVRGEGSGFSPISVGTKLLVVDSTDSRRPSLGTLLRVFPPSGSGDFHATRTTGDLRLLADWDLSERVSLNPNAGLAIYEDDGRSFTAGLFALTLNYLAREETINPFIDIGLQTPEAKGGGTALTIDGGVAYLPMPDLQLDVSIGTGAHGRTPPDFFLAAGASWRFHR